MGEIAKKKAVDAGPVSAHQFVEGFDPPFAGERSELFIRSARISVCSRLGDC